MKKYLIVRFVFLLLGSCLNINNTYSQSPTAELEQQLATLKNDSTKVAVLCKLSYAYVISEPDKSKIMGEQAIALARQIDNPSILVRTLSSISTDCIYLEDYITSSAYLREALEICKANGLNKLECMVLSNIAALYQELDVNEKAIDYLLQAYAKATETHEDYYMNGILNNIGYSYDYIGNYKEAIGYFLKSIEYSKRNKKLDEIASGYINLGGIYAKAKQWNESLSAFDSAQAIISRSPIGLGVRQVELSIGQAELYIDGFNNAGKAISIVSYLLDADRGAIPELYLCDIYTVLAKAYSQQGNFNERLKYRLLCYETLKELGQDDDLLIKTCLDIEQAYAATNNINAAYKWSHKCHVLRDSLNEQKEKRHTAMALVAHEIESRERELTEHNNALKLKQWLYSAIGLLSIPLALLVGFVLFYRYKLKLKNQYTTELEQKVIERTKDLELAHTAIQEAKERENISLALLNQEHAELLGLTIEKMENWQKQSALNDIQPAINDLKAAQTKANEWGSFMMHFERIHPNFAQSLQAQFPELSTNELKHCAYMRLGITRKQVAESLHTTDNAVKLARNRIRKKLGLSAEDSLQDFLNQWGAK